MKNKEKRMKPEPLRFEKGTMRCQKCGTFRDVIQFVSSEIIKGLPIEHHRFICRSCALELGLEKEVGGVMIIANSTKGNGKYMF